jgi:hypothetical protein
VLGNREEIVNSFRDERPRVKHPEAPRPHTVQVNVDFIVFAVASDVPTFDLTPTSGLVVRLPNR